jgi:hypothetical protein
VVFVSAIPDIATDNTSRATGMIAGSGDRAITKGDHARVSHGSEQTE